MEMYALGLILFLLIVFVTSKAKKADYNEANRVTAIIESKQKELQGLTKEVEDRTVDRSTSLTQTQIEVLDIYQDSNIRLPADIIEDLAYSRIHDYQEIFAYIENQRNYWKLENTKKPFKRSVTK